MKTDQDLPPSDRAEKPEKEIKTYAHNATLRNQVLALREEGFSNNKIVAKIGTASSSMISQYLNDAGCVYPGDVESLERKLTDFVRNEARRRASGVDTIESSISKQIAVAFEYARKTNDAAAIFMESGDGKTRGIEPYLEANPTCLVFRTRIWHRHETSLRKFFFEAAGKAGWDKQTSYMDHAVTKLRGSDRFFIFDDAHKLALKSLQLCLDVHDETGCPMAFVGTLELFEILEKDPQVHSRIGLKSTIGSNRPKEVIEHMIKSLVPDCNGEKSDLLALCEQVVANEGHLRYVSKHLKLAAEMRATSTKFDTVISAFRAAHTKISPSYKLS